MESRSLVLCDTDILIEFYKNNPLVLYNLKLIGQSHIAISVITVGEILFGALNKRELVKIKNGLDQLKIIYISQEIGDCFSKLMMEYTLSHHLKLPDGIIASTALSEGISLYTHNTRDFKYIKGIRLFQENKIDS